MKTLTTALAALVLASLCPALSLADEAPDAPSEGAGASFSCEAGLTLPLAGLTEDKVGQVERALRGMTQPRYRCPACKMISPWPMTCVGCGEPHEKMDTGAALYTSVQVDGASSSVCLEIDSKGTARMTEIAAALEPTGVSLDRAAISIVGWTRVTVRIDPEQLASARRALQKPGLFASIGVRRSKDGVSTTFVVQHPPRRPVDLMQVAQALGQLPGGVVFEDLSWTGACKPCKERGRQRGGCRTCWAAEIRRERARKPDQQ